MVTARGRWWKSEAPIEPLTEDRKVLVHRYMIDVEEAQAQPQPEAGEEANRRAADQRARRQGAPKAKQQAAKQPPRRQGVPEAKQQEAEQPARRQAAEKTKQRAAQQPARRQAAEPVRAVVRPILSSMISVVGNLERPDTGDVIFGVVVCALAICVGIAIALAT
jgi:hypothetical protein